ncbi:hypothetical protein [Aurantibacillus circumpalustris]|uniref:hypothetical protein n=1 Tax=Aurantibacillus circumpalustris TaxID=3036359 RepID=UPI00295C387E|nr:hypothetical protein [Aurantibacillus circumpalustris]
MKQRNDAVRNSKINRLKQLTFLNKYSPVSEGVIKLITESGSFHSYNKNELILAEGKYNAFEYFKLDCISH